MCWESGLVSQRQTMLARLLVPLTALACVSFLPSFIHLADTFASYLLSCYCFAERGPCSIALASLKPKVILLPQAPESCPQVHRCMLPCMPVTANSCCQNTRRNLWWPHKARVIWRGRKLRDPQACVLGASLR